MALFNKKELEALQQENATYKEKIMTLETRLTVLKKENARQSAKIEELEETLATYFSPHQMDKATHDLNNQINTLRKQLSLSQIRPRNERGAGRKRKATNEQVAYILMLSQEGKSYNAIAKLLTIEYNEPWNKTTIRNIVPLAKCDSSAFAEIVKS